MASLFSSVVQFHNSLTAANFPNATLPPAYEKPAPQVTAAGAQLRPPYVVYSLAALDEQQDFEDESIETYTLTAVAYADTQADADAIVKALRWNGQGVGGGAGFDNRQTLTNFTEGVLMGVVPSRPPVPSYSGVGISSQRAHQATMEWRVEVERS